MPPFVETFAPMIAQHDEISMNFTCQAFNRLGRVAPLKVSHCLESARPETFEALVQNGLAALNLPSHPAACGERLPSELRDQLHELEKRLG